MSLEAAFFEKKRVIFEKLKPFGFVKEKHGFVYREQFMAGDFEAHLKVSEDGQIFGRVLDTDTGDDYLALRVECQAGAFAGQVRANYIKILEKMAAACCEELPFFSDQTNRLANYIESKYGDAYDHPFAKYPAFSSYRNPANCKWYALIMMVARSKLGVKNEGGDKSELSQKVEIVNLKVHPDDMEQLLALKGIYPSYHMNKKSWISLVLDGSLADSLLFSLVDKSRALTTGKGLINLDGPDYWLVPANPKYYDIAAEFAVHSVVEWRQKASIKTGDYIGIYITAPIRALRYLCQVLESDKIPDDYDKRPDIKKLMRLKLLKSFDDTQFSAMVLKAHGVTNIRGPRRMTKELITEVEKTFK